MHQAGARNRLRLVQAAEKPYRRISAYKRMGDQPVAPVHHNCMQTCKPANLQPFKISSKQKRAAAQLVFATPPLFPNVLARVRP
jgi:hypothetical protein